MSAAQKTFWIIAVIALCALASCQQVRGEVSDRFLDAVAQVESSNNLNEISDGGKARGLFQFHRAAWEDARKAHPSLADYESGSLNREQSRQAARIYFKILAARFSARTHTTPSPGQLYAAFNCGLSRFLSTYQGRVKNCPATTRKAVNKLNTLLK